MESLRDASLKPLSLLARVQLIEKELSRHDAELSELRFRNAQLEYLLHGDLSAASEPIIGVNVDPGANYRSSGRVTFSNIPYPTYHTEDYKKESK